MWDARKHVQAEDEEIAGDKRTVSRKAGLLKYTFMWIEFATFSQLVVYTKKLVKSRFFCWFSETFRKNVAFS